MGEIFIVGFWTSAKQRMTAGRQATKFNDCKVESSKESKDLNNRAENRQNSLRKNLFVLVDSSDALLFLGVRWTNSVSQGRAS